MNMRHIICMLTVIVTVLSTAAPAIASSPPTKHLGRDVTSPGASPISIGDDGTAASRETAGPFGPSQLKMLYDSGPIGDDYSGLNPYYISMIIDLDGDGHKDLL